MSSQYQTGFYIEGMEEMLDVMNPVNFEKRLRSCVKVASGMVGTIGKEAIRYRLERGASKPPLGYIPISSKDFAPLKAPNLKSEYKELPMRDVGHILAAVRAQVVSWDEVRFGLLNRTITDSHGHTRSLNDIVKVAHYGRTFTVSDKMRRFFSAMAMRTKEGKTSNQVWHALDPGTSTIVVPPRPFLLYMLNKKVKYTQLYAAAVMKALISGRPGSKTTRKLRRGRSE